MKRAVLFAVALLAGAIVLAAQDGGNASARGAATGASAKMLDAGSSRFTLSVDGMQRADSFPSVVGEGVMDYVHHRGRLSYGHYSEQIFDGNVTFMTWPVPWHESARWLRIESDSSDTDPFDLAGRAMRNPAGLLEFLTAASNDVRDAGSERIRSTATNRIEGTFDMQKVVDNSPREQRAELQEWLNFLAEDTPTRVPFQLWIDNDGVARRLRVEGGATVTIEYYDFGVPVDVSVPPATAIITPQDLLSEFEAHAADSSCGSSGDVYSTASGGSICLERVE